MIQSGWPSIIQQFSVLLKLYGPFRDEFAVEDKIAMKSHHIIISTVLPKETLTKLHAAHRGTEETKLRASKSV